LSRAAFAIEKLRRSPSSMMTCRYWPALNGARRPIGKRMLSRVTSDAGRARRNILAVMVLRRKISMRSKRLGRMVRSARGCERHISANPSRAVRRPRPRCSTSPSTRPTSQVLHAPFRQEDGME
jgi:hypothetical protein